MGVAPANQDPQHTLPCGDWRHRWVVGHFQFRLWVPNRINRFPTRCSEPASQVTTDSQPHYPRVVCPTVCAKNKMVTSVPPSLSSNVTTMVISPEKAGSTESKDIAWTILVGGVSSANRAVKRSSRSEVLPRYTCSDEG